MKIDGGMINNNSFIQSIANILQINIIKPKNIETSALGAAYLAGLSSGVITDLKNISNFWKVKRIFFPKANKVQINKEISEWKATVNFLIKYHS